MLITNEKDYDLLIDLVVIREAQNDDIKEFMFDRIIEEIIRLSKKYKILKIKGE